MAAFSNASRVQISRGRKPVSISRMTASPEATAYSSRLVYGAGSAEDNGNASPIASLTQAIVLAVNWPPHAPSPGQAIRSSAASFSSLILSSPAACAPTASNTSRTVTSRPSNRPGKIDPPYKNTLGTFRRSIAIIIPGRDLSQPATPTSAS
ncbi:MAG: Uncharacterised protein [Hyphomonas sp. TMED17]|nr:MAG: Uncharacterised protein [Hyphomonas sp. TMED17]